MGWSLTIDDAGPEPRYQIRDQNDGERVHEEDWLTHDEALAWYVHRVIHKMMFDVVQLGASWPHQVMKSHGTHVDQEGARAGGEVVRALFVPGDDAAYEENLRRAFEALLGQLNLPLPGMPREEETETP